MKGSLEKGNGVFWVVGITTQLQHTVDENTNMTLTQTGAWKKGILKTVIKLLLICSLLNKTAITQEIKIP